MTDSIRQAINLVEQAADPWNQVRGALNSHVRPTIDRLRAAFPHGPMELLDLLADGEGWRLDMAVAADQVSIIGANGPAMQSVRRQIAFFAGEMQLDGLTLAPAAQRAGRGTRMLYGAYEVARRLNLKTMRMRAGQAGSYAWAKAGFRPAGEAVEQALRRAVRRRLQADMHRSLPAPVRREAEAALAGPNPAWAVADIETPWGGEKLGKRLLAGLEWPAVLSLADAEAVARLKACARRKGAAA